MDDFVETATEELWKEFQTKELLRAKTVMDKLIEKYINSDKSVESFKEIWYDQHSDKKGNNHIYNLAISCSQGRKSFAGRSFEQALEKLHADKGISILNQTWVDSEGNIHKQKPKVESVHKHDCIIPKSIDCKTISDTYIISIKTTLRERYREDLDSIGKCKNVIFLTREKLKKVQIQVITGYGCIVVFPNADTTENTWSYTEYFSRMKKFQESLCDSKP